VGARRAVAHWYAISIWPHGAFAAIGHTHAQKRRTHDLVGTVMTYDTLFDSDENKALIAICTRKLISNIGVGGIIWGVINTLLGVASIQASILNVGLVILGVMMLGTGIQAIMKPTLGVLLTETIVTVLLFVWNIGISIINFNVTGDFEPHGVAFPLIIALVFSGYYRKLGHLREQIASVAPEKIKATKTMCKTLVKKKLKDTPSVVQTTNRRCRAQLMEQTALFIQRDLMRAFVASRPDIREAIVKRDAKSLKLRFNHPVGKLVYPFNKKNSEKLRNWLAMECGQTTESNPN